ncbi:MAG: LPS assembly lipoprotein LptE [Methylococcales bacterium]
MRPVLTPRCAIQRDIEQVLRTWVENDSIYFRPGKLALVIVLGGVLSACGFHLRGDVDLPLGMKSIYAQGFQPGSQFLTYLDQSLKHSDGHLTTQRQDAGLILNALNEQFERREVSLSQAGKTNAYGLHYVLTYELQNPDGTVIGQQQTITIDNEYFNPQIDVIGKSEEENIIRKEMYQKAVRNLLNRVKVALVGRQGKNKAGKSGRGKKANRSK